ncbi:MAG: hypothetical protein ACI4S9_08775, partial [Christensenellales bacterium]
MKSVKRMMFLLLIVSLCVCFCGVSVSSASGEVDLLKETLLTLKGGAWNDGKVVLPGDSISRVYTQSAVSDMQSLNITMNIASNGVADWHAMMFILDNAPGKTSWERGAGERAYMLFWGHNALAIKNMSGSNGVSLTNGEYQFESDFYNTEHAYRIELEETEEAVLIKVYIDSELKIDATDSTENRITQDGAITIANHNVTGATVTVSAFGYVGNSDVEEIQFFDENDLKDNIAKLSGSGEYDASNGVIRMKNTSQDAQIAYTLQKFDSINAVIELSLDTSEVVAGYGDWYAFLGFSDLTPGVAPWANGGRRYMLAIYGNRIDLNYYDGGNATNLASYALADGYHNGTHKYSIMTVSDISGVFVWLKIDDVTAISAKDSSATAQILPGSVTLMTNDGANVAGTISKFLTSDYIGYQEESDANQFFETNPDIENVDFTDLVQGDIELNWTGTMQEAEFKGNVAFYSGNTKDNIYLRGPDIVSVATRNPVSLTADFVLDFKMTVTWGRRDTDWGGIFTFRDNNAGVAMWDVSSSNINRRAYAIRFDRSNDPDDETNGTFSLIKYNSAGSGTGLAEKTGLHLQGNEITFKLGVANVDANSNGSMDDAEDYVWIVVIANGEVWANYKDYGTDENP